VGQIAARGAFANTLAIDVELEAVVGADENDKVAGFGVQMKGFPEVVDAGLAKRRCGMRNPACMPLLAFIGDDLRRESRGYSKNNDGENHGSEHEVS
jgi:hypothetical protein